MANFIRDGVRRCTRHPTAPCLAAARALMSGRPPVQMRFFVGPVSQGRQNVVLCPYWVEAYGTDRERAFLEAVAPRADLPEDVVDRSILELLNDDLYPLRMLDPDGHTVEVDRLEEDPYPPADYPQMTNKERRFFFYFTVAKLLLELAGWGQTNAGVRIRLPQPVYDYISELWGEQEVGFIEPACESQASTVVPDDSQNRSLQASPVPRAKRARPSPASSVGY